MTTVLLTDYAPRDDAIERAVIEAAGHRLLSSGQLSGAGLDVVEGEPSPQSAVVTSTRMQGIGVHEILDSCGRLAVDAEMEARVATLARALLLARGDGKSPVAYFGDHAADVRKAALVLLGAPRTGLADVEEQFTQAMEDQ
jgi:hypothetical protein